MTQQEDTKEYARRAFVINRKIDDLIQLAELRQNQDLDVGMRFRMFNTMLDLLCISQIDNRYERLLNYRDKLGLTTPNIDVHIKLDNAFFGQVYQKKNSVLITELEITEEEQKSMKILINKNEKNRRSSRKRNSSTKIPRLVKKVKEKEMIKRLRSEGYSYSRIAEEMNITKSRVYYLDQAYNKKKTDVE